MKLTNYKYTQPPPLVRQYPMIPRCVSDLTEHGKKKKRPLLTLLGAAAAGWLTIARL